VCQLLACARNPNAPSMRVETMSMRVTSVFSTMDVMSTSVMSLSREMSVPGALLHTRVETDQREIAANPIRCRRAVKPDGTHL